MTVPTVANYGSSQECAELIREAANVLVICHIDPDGDAIGCLLGVGWFLQALGIRHVLACGSPEPSNLKFLPRTGPIVSALVPAGHDLIVTVDCNSYDRLGLSSSLQQLSNISVVNIDHHVTNTRFGTVNWVDSQAAATAEMIYLLAAPLGVTVSLAAATCLLTGIVTDTWGFRTPNTTTHTFETALRAMDVGADLKDIVSRTIESRNFSSLCLWARVLQAARLEDGVIWAEVTQADLRACGAKREGQNGLVNFLLTAQECKVAVVLTETGEQLIDVSLRSDPSVDVSQTAVWLGGGGHPQAAGCTLRVSLAEARTLVRVALLQSLSEQGVIESGVGAGV